MRGFATLIGVAAFAATASVASAQSAGDDYYETEEGFGAQPAPPAGAAPNLRVPERRADGSYDTPNRNLSPAEAAWHLRAALNVAALGCRDAAEAQTVARYNALLGAKRAVLAAADAAVRGEYRARHGSAWQGFHDSAMTRVYNFFAQPPAQAGFCAEAQAVLAEVGDAPAEAFVAAAPAALDRLERPFLAFYEDYGRYRTALAGWTGRAPGRALVIVASATPAVVAPPRR